MLVIQENLNMKLLRGEKIYTIQRKHPVSMILPLAAGVAIIAMLVVTFTIMFWLYPVVSPLFFINVMLLMLSLLIVFVMSSVMYWFYQFYVITNKRIQHFHFFQVQGKLSVEMFFTANTKIKVSRAATNLIYSILNVEDIAIEFRHDIHKEPFIIRAPNYPREIEEILDKLSTDVTSPLTV
ncbi:MAG TPA: hypothetical protein VGL94_07355 [Ktedonobacteraceae bacterium]|jgi:hypothetical protein